MTNKTNQNTGLITLAVVGAVSVAALTINGTTSTSNASNLTVTKIIANEALSTRQVDIFNYSDANGQLVYGFACECVKVTANKTTHWEGSAKSGCSSTSGKDQPYDLMASIVPAAYQSSAPLPPGACCLSKPVADPSLPPLPVSDGLHCWGTPTQ